MAEILSHPWFVWIIAAAIFGLFEMLLPHFGLVFAASAALFAALASLRLEFEYQMIIFAVTLLGGLFLLRPKWVKKIQSPHVMLSRMDQLVGKKARVIEALDPVAGTGRVELEDQDWSARSKTALDVGTTVIIESTDGIVVFVKKA